MMSEALKGAVLEALSKVTDPEGVPLGEDRIRNLVVSETGEVRFSMQLRPDDPTGLSKEARAVVEKIAGVRSVRINVQLPQSAPAPQAGGHGLKPGSVPAPTPMPGLAPTIRRFIAVSSGKGGVGKSMISSNLAAGLAARGLKVGLLDADIYGPNIPRMFGETRRPKVLGERGSERMEPLEAHGVQLMSLGFLLEPDQPAIMRGPLISGILKQFLEQVAWGELDVLIVDMPPGTGDAQLSLVQTIDLAGAVMVTTPQGVATGDVRRGVRMFERVNTPVLGIVENMAGEIFGSGGGEALARELDLPFLGRIPLEARVRLDGEEGRPTVLASPESEAGAALEELVATIAETLRD